VTTPLYFGCYREPGHWLWAPGMEPVAEAVEGLPWSLAQLDGDLAPPRARAGVAAVHRQDGWTAVAFWDRSIDRRPGANSVFLIPEELHFDTAMRRAHDAFPEVFAQLGFVVRIPGPARKARSTKHPPPTWWVEDAFIVHGPDGQKTAHHADREDAMNEAWDIYERWLQVPLPLGVDDSDG
jgi:hypothetical protein